MSKAVEEEIKGSLVEGKLQCAVAFQIAKKLGVTPKEVGDTANSIDVKIASCQLGCFP
jgi:hypothetical protein